ncbi:MAG: fibronectin type III domain-containing protein, partial [Verrucomicrobia bacterium]|nr:fibronectin type III domain-containing protein [Verrucomicrobiota bacterium]
FVLSALSFVLVGCFGPDKAPSPVSDGAPAFTNGVTPAVTVPGAITGLNATRTNGGIVVSFVPPKNDGRSAITGYTVTATPVGGGTVVSATGTSSPINVLGLTNGTGYSFAVTATNALGSGSAVSSPAVIIPSTTLPTTPGPATGITAAKTSNGVLVDFTPPVDNGGSTITGYTVIASPVGGGTNIQTTGKSPPIAVTGLSVGMNYIFSVLTTNATGTTALATAPASAPLSFKGTIQQSISLSAPGDRQSDGDPFALPAVASSGLPVTLAITSGPALLTGNTLTLTGGVGMVAIRATQPGDGIYAAAPDVTTSFRVRAATVNIYFGGITNPMTTAKVGEMAAVLTPKTNECSLLIVAPESGINASVALKIAANGDFSASFSSLSASPSGASVSGETQRAAAPVPYSLRGRLMNGRLQGVIDPSGISFDAPVLSADGPSASSAGFYESTALGSRTGKTYAVVGTANQVLTLASTPEVTVGGVTQLKPNLTIEFGAQLNSAPVQVSLKIDPDTTTIEGGVSVAGKTPVSMAGLLNTTLPTDRVINLSSRGTSGNGRTLISGFVISGTAPKRVLLRAVGPALARFGLSSALANPKLEVFNSAGRVILENDDWVGIESAAAIAQVGAF